MLSGRAGPAKSTSLQALGHLTAGRGVAHKLLSGYTAMVARNLPFTAIQFPIFEYARTRIWRRREGTGSDGAGYGAREKRGLLETGVITGTSAGLAGSFAAVVTTPMDVVKTRMMLMAGGEQDGGSVARDGQGKSKAETTNRNQNGLAVARQVIKERGVPGLFRGSVLRAVWTAVGSGLYLGMYEVSKVWLTRGKDAEDETFP
ncbi:mitochondrial carrier domain-containing protein [Truncatella angustata]|uniref:Mitochondrial carrier domain-containing protein n=1 Tax=Truncatella angustata TaxID=152316 RepID=A0A9P8RIP7_9PEZI|nr:mitochondrial carrier domain-containing protein [Truncatella angustata]KAH6646602.1 mitochondrial carrier domain-containing protein [Truncatella angustata]